MNYSNYKPVRRCSYLPVISLLVHNIELHINVTLDNYSCDGRLLFTTMIEVY